MLLALIMDRGLAPEVNTVKEFVVEARAYESSVKTAVHYLEHNQNHASHSGPMVHKCVDKVVCREMAWGTLVPLKPWVALAAGAGAQCSTPRGQVLPKPTPVIRGLGIQLVTSKAGHPLKDDMPTTACFTCGKKGYFAYDCEEPYKAAL